jgi:thiol-disulfide isomerase/thioredoxin
MAVLAVIGLLGFGLFSKGGQTVAVGEHAPEVELTGLDGSGAAGLDDFEGQWVLVNFWSSWCEPCRTESPALERFHRANRGLGFTVVGVDLEDVRADAITFVEELGLTYPQLRARSNEEVVGAFGILGRPENFLIDPAGKIALVRRGPVTPDYLDRYVRPLLPEGP